MSAATNKPQGAATGSIRDAGAGRFTLEGAVTMATVTGLRGAGLQAFARGSGAIEVDLAGVQRADSGALALMVDWLAWARTAGRALTYTSVPAALLALARLSGVDELLVGSGANAATPTA
jgi:phospholipid transport system transporter-binding protein